MSIFLDKSKKRKHFFRTFVIVASVTVVSITVYFAYSIIFNKSIRSAPVKYNDTKESYHYYFSPANKKKVAITFDDGPVLNITRSIAETLEKNDVPATFFFIGQNILLYPNLVKEVHQKGFEIGNHSFTHDSSIHDTQNRINLELRSTNYLIEKITGETPKYYRPPFLLGIGVDPTVNPYSPIPKDLLWTLENGLIPTGVDIDPKDWVHPSEKDVVTKLELSLSESPNGHIILLHEESQTADALQNIIDLLKSKGYSIVSLDELLTPPSEINLYQNLSFGMTDENTNRDVSKLQWFLFKQGDLDPYLLTGKYDFSTKNAVTSFQLRNGLIDPNNVDPKRVGIVDEATRSLIYSLTKKEQEQVPMTTVQDFAQKISRKVGRFALNVYINYAPAIRISIIWMTRFALGLVLLRVVFLFGIIIASWIKNKFFKTEDKLVSDEEFGVTVLIPAFNEEENIKGTIESVMKSTYKNKEIIIINDGSTDNTRSVIEKTLEEHNGEKIKLLNVENGGKSMALNHGIKEAKFDICVVIDADAVLHKDALKYFVPHFKNPKIGAVAGKVNTTGRGGFLNLFQTVEYAIGQNIDKKVFSVLGAVGIVPGPAGAWRKELIIKAGGFSNDTLVEDQDMTLTILKMGHKVVYEPRAVSYTETPDTINNFLKQRFRWIYGTIQCFWKSKGVVVERPFSTMSLVVIPNIFIFNILLPLTYPFADLSLILGLMLGDWQHMLLPFLLFSIFDVIYAWIGVFGEKRNFRLVFGVPLQRFSYRQLIYYSVFKSVVKAIEGTESGWNKFTKTGETQRFYFELIDDDKSNNLQIVK